MNRKTVVIAVVAIVLLVAIIIGALVLLVMDKPEENGPNIGVLNPNVMGSMTQDEVESKEKREQLEQAKPTMTPDDAENFDEEVLRKLSDLNFSALSSYVMKNADRYQSGDRIQDLKIDIANTLAATEANANMLLMTYRTSDVLAAAVAKFPMSYKLNAFLSADSLIFPAQESGIDLRVADVTQEQLDAMLERANKNMTSYDRRTDVAAYDMILNGLPCRLWEVKTPNGWQPFLLEQIYNYTTGVLTQLEAQKIQASFYNSGMTLDQVVSMEFFDEAAYRADMEAHPEDYNPDGSLKVAYEETDIDE